MTDLTPEPILQIASGFLAAKHLFVAGEIGLFEILAQGPMTLDELTRRTGIPRRTLRISADAMVALGIVTRHGDRYSNTPVSTAFLSGAGGPDLRPFLRFWNRLSYPRWMRLEEAVRTDKMIFGESSFTDQEQELYSEGVEAVTAGTAHALAESYDFRRISDSWIWVAGPAHSSSPFSPVSVTCSRRCSIYRLLPPPRAADLRKHPMRPAFRSWRATSSGIRFQRATMPSSLRILSTASRLILLWSFSGASATVCPPELESF